MAGRKPPISNGDGNGHTKPEEAEGETEGGSRIGNPIGLAGLREAEKRALAAMVADPDLQTAEAAAGVVTLAKTKATNQPVVDIYVLVRRRESE